MPLDHHNRADRYSLAIDAIDRVPRLQEIGAHVKEWLKDQILDAVRHSCKHGIDRQEITDWKWPF